MQVFLFKIVLKMINKCQYLDRFVGLVSKQCTSNTVNDQHAKVIKMLFVSITYSNHLVMLQRLHSTFQSQGHWANIYKCTSFI